MKRYIIIIILFLVSFISYGQTHSKDSVSTNEDVKISINISKINRGLGKVVGFISNEVKQFKQETEENITPEDKAKYKQAKEDLLYELKYIHDAIHQGYVTGLRGEEYTPPYKHK